MLSNAEACLLAEHQHASRNCIIKSRLQTEKTSCMMNREDMDLVVNKAIQNPVGAMNYFANSGIVDLRDDTPGLREGRQSFDGSNQLLSNEQCVVGRILRDELPDRLDIFNSPASPDQRSHLRS